MEQKQRDNVAKIRGFITSFT